MGGLFNVLEVVCEMGCVVFILSFIGVFGNNIFKDKIL